MSNTRRAKNAQIQRQQTAPKGTQAVVAVVAVLCIAAVIALALVLNNRNDSTPVAAGTPTTAPSASSGALACDPAPQLPAKPLTFDKAPSPSLAENASWDVTLSTNCGDIEMTLDGTKAPQTVASFLFLARKGYFDNSPCHRLTTSDLYVLQCGDPTGTGTGGPGYGFGIENAPKTGSFPTGTVAMARATSPNSNGSQFFIVYKNTSLPTTGGGYSIFGTVTKGLDIVDEIAKAGVTGGGGDGAPAQAVSILGVTATKAGA
jgi:peptidyl-prolyl cis-trans isomerase B (cyclophilin B)